MPLTDWGGHYDLLPEKDLEQCKEHSPASSLGLSEIHGLAPGEKYGNLKLTED